MKPNRDRLGKIWLSDNDGDLIHSESVPKHDKARRRARRPWNCCFARERNCIRRVRGKPIDRVRFNRNDQLHQVVVEIRHHVPCENRREATAQLSEADCRRGSLTCDLRRFCEMPLVFTIGSEVEDSAHADHRESGNAIAVDALMPIERARCSATTSFNAFGLHRTAKSPRRCSSSRRRQSEQRFARCVNTNRSSRLQLAQGAADTDAFLVAKQG